MFIKLCVTFVLCSIIAQANAIHLGRIYVNELFSTKIEPKLFNWTFGKPEQFQYRPSIKGYPDLPSWMRYMYSNEYYGGYLYGTPPSQAAGREIILDVVGLNKLNYETKRITITILVIDKKITSLNSVQMKIDNLNWVQLMDPGRVENLKNIFRNDLWPECKNDLFIIFMESAIRMGGRIPLRPQQKEGVIIHLGSAAPFSNRLIDLQEEIRPLYKIASCTYKRTSVQTIFETAGFKMDWCAFKIADNNDVRAAEHNHMKSNQVEKSKLLRAESSDDQWESLARSDVPQRNYIDELAFAIAIPGMILTILIAILSAVLCFYHDKINEKVSAATVQMVHYSTDNNHPVTTLKSLKDPTHHIMLDDDQSLRSQSPCNSMYRAEGSPRGHSTLRPRPPPYKPPTAATGLMHKSAGADI